MKAAIRRLLPRGHKAHRILSGPLRGRRIVTSWRDYPAAICGYAERKLTHWLLENVRPGETWLDVGAHYGYTSLTMCERVSGDGRVFAFEPSLATVACLERTRRENGFWHWNILPFALADYPHPTLLEFATTRGMIDSQIRPEDSDGISRILAFGLDALWDADGSMSGPIHGIKIDVQGMELEALRGMTRVLASYRPKLVLEIHQGVPRDAILAVIGSCGYDATPISIEEGATDFFDPESNFSFAFSAAR